VSARVLLYVISSDVVSAGVLLCPSMVPECVTHL
jgi:hypothetical protein